MSPARLAGHLFGGAAALGAGGYLVIYLYRWQWQRAILCGVLLLVVEVLLLGLAVLDRVGRLERRLRDSDRRHEEIMAVLGHAGEPHGGEGRPRFAWLAEDDGRGARTYVFVPVLMAAGVALSGLSWLVERLARRTVAPVARARLAGRLAGLAAPPGGARAGTAELPDRPLKGPGRPQRAWRRAVAWAVAGALCVVLYAALAELTETDPPHTGDATATSVLYTVDPHRVTAERARLAARQVWERCRDSTSVPLRHAGMTGLSDGLFAATVYPSLSDHDAHRLVGCLEDTTLDRVQFAVVGVGDVGDDPRAVTGR